MSDDAIYGRWVVDEHGVITAGSLSVPASKLSAGMRRKR
jgi:hypothetical protein